MATNSFTSLPVADRQVQLNAVLVPAVKRLPLRIRRNHAIMGSLTKFTWELFNTAPKKVTQASLIKHGRSLEVLWQMKG